MEEKVLLLEMFSLYEPPEALRDALSQAVVLDTKLDVTNRYVGIRVYCPVYITLADLKRICADIGVLYGDADVHIDVEFAPDQLQAVPATDLRDMFVLHNSIARAVLAGAAWEWEGQKLTVNLKANGKDLLGKSIAQMEDYLSRKFMTKVSIQVNSQQAMSAEALFEATEKMRAQCIAKLPVHTAPTAEKPPVPSDDDLIFGKQAIKGKVIPMKNAELDMAKVIVEGRVIAVEHKELPKRKAVVVKFDITDNTSSVRVSRFLEQGAAKPIVEKVKVGSVVRVSGKLTIDNFTNEMVLKPDTIMRGYMPKRMDRAPGRKRVELHLHTNMSNMDALTNTTEAIKQAAQWGHRAIAITDHGCVQSFTEAVHLVDPPKKNIPVAGTDEFIKILYGCEAYYINDVDDHVAVIGKGNMPIDGEYVAFDVETTGFYPRRDKIIEIGAARMKDGEVLERFQTFVDPGCKLENRTSVLTGITDSMLKGAPSIRQAMKDFLAFVGDRPLVAHNAAFDTSFIAWQCESLGIDYPITALDTLTIAQNILPKQNKYTLDAVAKYFDLEDFNHHRAEDDAVICGRIMAELVKLLKQMGVTDIQQIQSATVHLRPQHRQDSMHNQHIVLFAKNQLGLRNLYRLISEANLYHFRKFPRIFKSELMKYREGLIIGSACENNELFQAVIGDRPESELLRLAEFYDYLEVQPISNNRFMLRPKKEGEQPIAVDDDELRSFNRRIVALGEKMGKPVVATGDVHFLNPEDEIYRHVLLAFKNFDDADNPNPLYFRTTDEMLAEFSYLGEKKAEEIVIDNPNMIADMCDIIRPVPHNLFAPSIENSVEDLKSLVYGKFHRLYGENPPESFVRRVETELGDIISCHYDVIYMSAQKLVQNSLENGYLVGSRGSVGSSIVAYLSGITEVNSFPPHYRCPNPDCKHTQLDVPKGFNCGADLPDAVCPKCGTAYEKDGFNIPFETFLGFGGDKVPDIDLNFSGEYQARAHAYCTEMFGKSHVFRAGTIGTVAEKTAFGYAKKFVEERGLPAGAAELARLASGCVGVRRTTGQHPGGLVVIPQENEIWDFCPVQHPADDPKSDQITTHFEYHSMEENLLKLDMLGHDDPTMIRMMEDMTGVDAKTIPLDDKDTMSIFTSSKVLGYENDEILGPTGAVAVPEFNTRFTRGVLLDTMPEKFDFLVRISGYTHGTDVWLGNARDLITSKTTTVDGTIGCRDDIMLYLISCGLPEKRAFKIMESVRKGRGLPEGAEEEMKAAGVPEWYIGSCKKIKYLFPKAHAVAYVMMAFRIAWFKVNYPLAFYSAYFYRRSQKGGFDALMMSQGIDSVIANIHAIENNESATDKDDDLLTTLEVVYEFYLRGLDFLPVDIYKSHATKFLIEDGKIRLPFVSLPGLGENAAWNLMEGREGRDFISVEEVAAACPKISKTHIQLLRDAGAFGSLPDSTQVSLF